MYCEKVTKNKINIWGSLFVLGFLLITLIVTTAAGANAPAAQPPQIIEKFDVEQDFDVRKALAHFHSTGGQYFPNYFLSRHNL